MGPTKADARDELKAGLRRTTAEERATRSAVIRAMLADLPEWQEAGTVMLFAAMRYEVDLLPLLRTAVEKRLIFPAMEDGRIVARQVVAEDQLGVENNIREPRAEDCPEVSADEIDLVLIPGLGFGRDGTRLGRGKGHYDRFLAGLPAGTARCGVCFVCQLRDDLPSEGHDIPVPVILSEEGIYRLPRPETGVAGV